MHESLNKIISSFEGHTVPFLISLFIFITGISSGIFLELAMDEDAKMHAASFLSKSLYFSQGELPSYQDIVLNSLPGDLGLLLLIMISGLTSIGFPFTYMILLFKGITLGFSAGLIIENYAAGSIPIIFFSMLPQNLIALPCLIIASGIAQSNSMPLLFRAKKQTKNNRYPEKDTGCYITSFLIIAAFMIISCLVESAIYYLQV